MTPEDFVLSLKNKGYLNVGLCIFAPNLMAILANKMLRDAHGADNLSVPMRKVGGNKEARYLAGNYSSAPLDHFRSFIEVLENIPEAVVLITEPGVGAENARTLGLLENGKITSFEGGEYSFFSFAENYLSIVPDNSNPQTSFMKDIRDKAQQVIGLRLGTDIEIETRRELLVAIDYFDTVFGKFASSASYGCIGHNGPPLDLNIPQSTEKVVNLNILIIRELAQSKNPDLDRGIKAASALSDALEEIVDFFRKTKEDVKSIGSKLLAGSIVGAIATIIWSLYKWMCALIGLPPF